MKLNSRELATVLAALRLWQRDLEEVGVGQDMQEFFTEYEPLSSAEITQLCERLNFGEPEG